MIRDRTVFLDRDGVINRERSDYVKRISEFVFIDGALEALHRLFDAGYSVFVITNQSAIGRGVISESQLQDIHFYMQSMVSEAGGKISAIFSCPHTPTQNCKCRKPKIWLLEEASKRFNISLKDSWFVGDKPSDEEAGRLAGCKTINILSNTSGALLEAAKKIIDVDGKN